MSSVVETPNSFVWAHRGILPGITALAIPAAIEALVFGYQCFKNPGLLTAKFEDFKSGFCQQPGESDRDYAIKVAKKVAKIAVVLLVTAAIGVAAYHLAPAGMAVGATIVASLAVFKIYQAVKALPETLKNVKDFMSDTFTQRPGESDANFKQRRYEGCKKIALYTTLFAVSVGIAIGGIYLGGLIAEAPSPWAIYDVLPYQTTLGVFAEYCFLGVAHASLSSYYYLKGDKALAAFHMSAAMMSIAFPICYAEIPGQELRLHHSFIGLALMLAPSRAVKTLGTFITLDSSLYFFNLQDPGYDYMNALLEQKSLVSTSIPALTVVQLATEALFTQKSPSPISKNIQTAK